MKHIIFIIFWFFVLISPSFAFSDIVQQSIILNGAPATISCGLAISEAEAGSVVRSMLTKGVKLSGGEIGLAILALQGGYYLYSNWDSVLAHFKDPNQSPGFYIEKGTNWSQLQVKSTGTPLIYNDGMDSDEQAGRTFYSGAAVLQITLSKDSQGRYFASLTGLNMTNGRSHMWHYRIYNPGGQCSYPQFQLLDGYKVSYVYQDCSSSDFVTNAQPYIECGTAAQAEQLLKDNPTWLGDMKNEIRPKSQYGPFVPDVPWNGNKLTGSITQGPVNNSDINSGQKNSVNGSDTSTGTNVETTTNPDGTTTTKNGTIQLKTDYGTMSNPDQPVFGDFDSSLSQFTPESKDISGLVSTWLDNAPFMAWARSFKVAASGGQSSFVIPTPLGSTGVIDFSKFDFLWSAIASIVVAFAYIYAACIILKGN